MCTYLCLTGCSGDEATPVENTPPSAPSDPNPADGGEAGIDIDLSWTCKDDQGDPLIFDIYLGEQEGKLVILETAHKYHTYHPPPLEYNVTYHWKIAADDRHDHRVEGPVWSLSTQIFALSQLNVGTTENFNGVWGSSKNDVYVVMAGHIFHYDGSGWDDYVINHPWRGVGGSSANDVWIGCDWSNVQHYNGGAWGPLADLGGLGDIGHTYGIWANSSSDVWVVGHGAEALHFDGVDWKPQSLKGSYWLRDIWGAAKDDVYAVGTAESTWPYPGAVLHFGPE